MLIVGVKMKNKIGILIACMLLFAFIIPISGVAGEPNNVIIIAKDPNYGRQPPDPGDLPEDFEIPGVFHNMPRNVDPPYVVVESIDDTIVEILQQINESLVLGYLQDLVDIGPRVTGTQGCE